MVGNKAIYGVYHKIGQNEVYHGATMEHTM